MIPAPGRLVIRTYAPLRRYVVFGGATLLGLLLLYVAFEAGRVRADAQGLAAQAELEQLGASYTELEAANRELRLRIATQETSEVAQGRERTEVQRTIGELQAQVARQSQDLAFYRGIVGDKTQGPPVRIQQFRVTKGSDPRRFLLRLVLGRPVRPDDVVNGTIGITVEGSQGESPATLDLAALTLPDTVRELRFNYRYLQTFEQAIVLPEGFRPARSTVEIRLGRKGAEPLRQTFLWKLDNA
ncbi:MAG: hypothetical protein EOP08_00445 [Proteobacteria bacterium]|nr:MAG: hypothetical protein EOP08_00445 [Pseudomonadota bacterium]